MIKGFRSSRLVSQMILMLVVTAACTGKSSSQSNPGAKSSIKTSAKPQMTGSLGSSGPAAGFSDGYHITDQTTIEVCPGQYEPATETFEPSGGVAISCNDVITKIVETYQWTAEQIGPDQCTDVITGWNETYTNTAEFCNVKCSAGCTTKFGPVDYTSYIENHEYAFDPHYTETNDLDLDNSITDSGAVYKTSKIKGPPDFSCATPAATVTTSKISEFMGATSKPSESTQYIPLPAFLDYTYAACNNSSVDFCQYPSTQNHDFCCNYGDRHADWCETSSGGTDDGHGGDTDGTSDSGSSQSGDGGGGGASGGAVGGNIAGGNIAGGNIAGGNIAGGNSAGGNSAGAPILGCKTAGYDNYNAAATQDDGSCSCHADRVFVDPICTPVVYGCRDMRYDNFSWLANSDGPACACSEGRSFDGNACQTTAVVGCRDSTYDNYLPTATQDGDCRCNAGNHYSDGGCIPDQQAQAWTGIRQFSGSVVTNIDARAITHDAENNVIAGGWTMNQFDNDEVQPLPGEEPLPVHQSGYIIKYDSSGTKKWIRRFGPSNFDYDTVNDLATDSANNIYSVGMNTANLGGYVRKFDKDGHTLWNTVIGGLNHSTTIAQGIAFDSEGNLIVVGDTTDRFGGSDLGQKIFFIAGFDAATGTRKWLHTLGGGQLTNTSATRIARGPNGDLYFAGYTTGNISGKKSPAGMYDCLIGRFGRDGVQKWIKQYGDAGGSTSCANIAIDSLGAIYVDGLASGAVLSATDVQNRAASTSDGFIAKFTESVDENQVITLANAWTRQFGGSQAATSTQARGMALDSNGNIFVGGQTTGSLFDNQLTGTKDMYVANFTSAGVLVWSKQVGNAQATVYPYDIDVDSTGGIFVTGVSDAAANENACPAAGTFVMKFLPDGTQP